jgi:hypothetical protein
MFKRIQKNHGILEFIESNAELERKLSVPEKITSK